MAIDPRETADDAGPDAKDTPETTADWLKKKVQEDEDDGAHSSTIASTAGRIAQSTDAMNQY